MKDFILYASLLVIVLTLLVFAISRDKQNPDMALLLIQHELGHTLSIGHTLSSSNKAIPHVDVYGASNLVVDVTVQKNTKRNSSQFQGDFEFVIPSWVHSVTVDKVIKGEAGKQVNIEQPRFKDDYANEIVAPKLIEGQRYRLYLYATERGDYLVVAGDQGATEWGVE